MKLVKSKSPNAISYYVYKSVWCNGTSNSELIEKIGTRDDVLKRCGSKDPDEWLKEYVAELTRLDQEKTIDIPMILSQKKRIEIGEQKLYNGGYLFLQSLYYKLGMDKMCAMIKKKYKFKYDLDSIMSRLLYGRIIYPASKLATNELSRQFIQQPKFELQHIYRALDVMAKESDYIQETLYKNSVKISKRNTGILYYDVTNYFFEIEEESGIKQYGYSKEHRPNPITQMGLFMDGDGIPLAFSIEAGNTNEQLMLKPLEKKILKDFELSRFVVCTDAGLSSTANRQFNDIGGRAFVTTQSIKKLKAHIKKWALSEDGWRLTGSKKTYSVSEIDKLALVGDEDGYSKSAEAANLFMNSVFFKEQWINEDGLEQRIIVSYSVKYKNYQRKIRSNQIERASKLINSGGAKVEKKRATDYKRFIKKTSTTEFGELADKNSFALDHCIIRDEEQYDGFYGVCTNLEDDASEIIRVNSRRWEIEECFRIMKTEFKSRPVYLSNDDRIKAHFLTCFMALTLFRLLEKKLNESFTADTIIDGLRNMNFLAVKNKGYIPAYTRTAFTDAIHDAFGFITDTEIVPTQTMKNIFSSSVI